MQHTQYSTIIAFPLSLCGLFRSLLIQEQTNHIYVWLLFLTRVLVPKPDKLRESRLPPWHGDCNGRAPIAPLQSLGPDHNPDFYSRRSLHFTLYCRSLD